MSNSAESVAKEIVIHTETSKLRSQIVDLFRDTDIGIKRMKSLDALIEQFLTTFAAQQVREAERRVWEEAAQISEEQIVADDDKNSMNSYADGVCRGIAESCRHRVQKGRG